MIEARGAQYQNNEIIQGSISNNIVSYYDTSLSSSTDPLASKTNKYIESESVLVIAMDKAIWVKFSSGGTAAAKADNNFYIEAGTSKIFKIEDDKRYIRILEDAASARSLVVELQ